MDCVYAFAAAQFVNVAPAALDNNSWRRAPPLHLLLAAVLISSKNCNLFVMTIIARLDALQDLREKKCCPTAPA